MLLFIDLVQKHSICLLKYVTYVIIISKDSIIFKLLVWVLFLKRKLFTCRNRY